MMSLLFVFTFSVAVYSNTDFLNLDPLLVIPSILSSEKSGVISFSIARMVVLISLPDLLLLLITAISRSSENRSIIL